MSIRKHFLIIVISLIVFLISGCRKTYVSVSPTPENSHMNVRLKVYYKDDHGKYSGKVILLVGEKRAKVLILNPLGRIFFKVLLEKELADAIRIRKRRRWQGPFNQFIQRIWGLDFSFHELKKLIFEGHLPLRYKEDERIDIIVTRENRRIRSIAFTHINWSLKIRVLSEKTKRGQVSFLPVDKKFIPVDLNTLFAK